MSLAVHKANWTCTRRSAHIWFILIPCYFWVWILHTEQRYRRRSWGQIPLPPHSLQYDRWRLWGQMLLPPHSLQKDRWRLCGQMPRPPQSLHNDLWRLWRQMLLPPHSLHNFRWRLWGQISRPPHSLHSDLLHLWSQKSNCSKLSRQVTLPSKEIQGHLFPIFLPQVWWPLCGTTA